MNIELRREIGQRLKEARNKAGLTQQEAAKELGYKAGQTVSLWECGDTMPKGDDWFKLGLLYGVSLDLLVYGERRISNSKTSLLQKIFGNKGVQPTGAAFGRPGFDVSV